MGEVIRGLLGGLEMDIEGHVLEGMQGVKEVEILWEGDQRLGMKRMGRWMWCRMRDCKNLCPSCVKP